MLIYTSHYFKDFDNEKYYTVQISSAALPNKKPDTELDMLYPPDDLRLRYKKSEIKWDAYAKAYSEFLDTLDVNLLKEKIEQIYEAAQSQKKEVVLVCWESDQNFCHRSLISAFIQKHLGIESKEIG